MVRTCIYYALNKIIGIIKKVGQWSCLNVSTSHDAGIFPGSYSIVGYHREDLKHGTSKLC